MKSDHELASRELTDWWMLNRRTAPEYDDALARALFLQRIEPWRPRMGSYGAIFRQIVRPRAVRQTAKLRTKFKLRRSSLGVGLWITGAQLHRLM